MLLLSVCLLAILSLGATQDCSMLQENELEGTDGLIADLAIADNPGRPSVTVNDFTIVCFAAANTRDRYRFVSVVVDFACSGNPICMESPAQYDFQCSSGSWIAAIEGASANVRGTPATGTLTTTPRTNCSYCFGSSVAAILGFFGIDPASVDSETHCAPCNSSCPGLCTGPEASQCCNVFMNNMCQDNCDDGFEPREDGTCVVSCGPLDDIPNGHVVLTTTFVNSMATYECDTGYNLSEDVTRTCVDNGGTGTWSMSEPTCIIVNCGNLPDPDNGNVNHPTTTFGSIATYSCDSGFELNGNERRTCQANGTWGGSAEPTCETILDPCDNVQCINGICSNGICTCNSGFTGPPCVCICGARCNAMCECMPSFYIGERCETCACESLDRCTTGSGPDFECECTAEYHGPPDCSTTPVTPPMLFQLQLTGIRNCLEWVSENTEAKLEDVAAAVAQKTNELCQCDFTEQSITDSGFQCFSDTTAVTFRARLHGTASASSSELVSYIEQWVESGTSILVQGVRLAVDDSCQPIVITSFDHPECDTTTDPQSDNTGPIVGGVVAGVAVVLISLLILVIAYLVLKNHRAELVLRQHTLTEISRASDAGVIADTFAAQRPSALSVSPDADFELVAELNPAYHTTLLSRNRQQEISTPDVGVYETIPGDTDP